MAVLSRLGGVTRTEDSRGPTWVSARAWSRRWPRWAPWAAAMWSAGYAVVAATWAGLRIAVPWRPGAPLTSGALLTLSLIGLVGGLASLGSRRVSSRRWVGVTVQVALIGAIAVFGIGMAAPPEYLVTLAVTLPGLASRRSARPVTPAGEQQGMGRRGTAFRARRSRARIP
jgi:hypothetical protein